MLARENTIKKNLKKYCLVGVNSVDTALIFFFFRSSAIVNNIDLFTSNGNHPNPEHPISCPSRPRVVVTTERDDRDLSYTKCKTKKKIRKSKRLWPVRL